ncbi:hypothetical protein GGX14DRAFT_392299 [Mycena pura]|uniref:Uncharacterized protein n=1 Tax=Mycena pura TaxID=153505 RepID=A0AAD6VNU1_9AGAR|nr:hypothetical protein GGX14DRAFT_392299 [Mycena pura]
MDVDNFPPGSSSNMRIVRRRRRSPDGPPTAQQLAQRRRRGCERAEQENHVDVDNAHVLSFLLAVIVLSSFSLALSSEIAFNIVESACGAVSYITSTTKWSIDAACDPAANADSQCRTSWVHLIVCFCEDTRPDTRQGARHDNPTANIAVNITIIDLEKVMFLSPTPPAPKAEEINQGTPARLKFPGFFGSQESSDAKPEEPNRRKKTEESEDKGEGPEGSSTGPDVPWRSTGILLVE